MANGCVRMHGATPRGPDHISEIGACRFTLPSGALCGTMSAVTFPYCPAHLLATTGLEVRPSSLPRAGMGLFYQGCRALRAGDVITFYSGKELVTTAAYESRYDPQVDARGVETEFGVSSECGRWCLDGGSTMNFPGRWINDARDPTRTNAAFGPFRTASDVVALHGRACIPIVATKTVRPGQELFLSYGRAYWEAAT